jgi:hypothetical protein
MKKTRVRLTKKLAEVIDGVDLSRHVVGETLTVSPLEARLLIAEGWAEKSEPRRYRESSPAVSSVTRLDMTSEPTSETRPSVSVWPPELIGS